MKLNTPYWAVIKDDKIMWDYGSPMYNKDKQAILDWVDGIVVTCKQYGDTYCGLDAETWQKLEIKQIIIKEV